MVKAHIIQTCGPSFTEHCWHCAASATEAFHVLTNGIFVFINVLKHA